MQIEFIPANTAEPAAKYIAEHILDQLGQNRSVFWLLSGGSCIAVAVSAAKLLAGKNLSGLTVSLSDERYGLVGHPDSNWFQLKTAGLELPGAILHPVLLGESNEATAEAFEAFLMHEFANTDYHLGLLGFGPDGHTSGILPHSPAVTASGLVSSYDGGGYQRITVTQSALSKLNEAVVNAIGKTKWPVLDRFETELSVAQQPAQALKSVAKVTIFTDRPLT